jgi:hypothetical protein
MALPPDAPRFGGCFDDRSDPDRDISMDISNPPERNNSAWISGTNPA